MYLSCTYKCMVIMVSGTLSKLIILLINLII